MMKKNLIFLMGLLVVLSCGQKSRSSSASDDEEKEQEELKLKEYSFSDEDGMAHVSITMAFPEEGDDELVDAIRQYLANQAEVESDEVELSDGQAIVDYYGTNLMNHMKELAKEYEGDDYVTEVYQDWTFSKNYETDEYVTFDSNTEIYEGGIHGLYSLSGITFFKDGGKQFSYAMLKDTDSPKFQKLLRDGLRTYFESEGHHVSDRELEEELIAVEDINNIPLPAADPYLTEDGVTFIYQPYEISYYAAGTPTFSISIEKMKPFLTQKALNLLDE